MVSTTHESRYAIDESIRLLIKLHLLMADGQSESPAADELRDRMESPWYAMSELEQERVRGLSADLYTLTNDSPFKHPLEGNGCRKELIDIIGQRIRNRSFDEVLELLRSRAEDISLQRATMVRGICYECLGHADVAELFIRFAAEREGYSGDATTKLLSMLNAESEIEFTDWVLSRSKSPSASLLLYIAFLKAKHSFSLSKDQALALIEDARSLTEQALSLPGATAQQMSLATGPFHTIIVALWHFGASDKALAVAERTIQLFPSDGIAYTIRGMVHESLADVEHIGDFHMAVKNRSPFSWPYARLAFACLENGEYEECLRLCQEALIRTASGLAKANILEWMAIACFLAGQPATLIRRYFMQAISLAPDNARIKNNFTAFEAANAAESLAPEDQIIKASDRDVFENREDFEHSVMEFA
jgi:tetratricopeptide (TPR) repeat protein